MTLFFEGYGILWLHDSSKRVRAVVNPGETVRFSDFSPAQDGADTLLTQSRDCHSPIPALTAKDLTNTFMSDDIERYDYSEGASPIEIKEALSSQKRNRRDSQVGSAYDDDGAGAVFGGPAAGVVPSSITTMHHDRSWRRRSSDARSRTSVSRRQSEEIPRPAAYTRRSSDRISTTSQAVSDDDQLSDAGSMDMGEMSTSMGSKKRSKRRWQRPSSPDSPGQSRGMFDSIANLFTSSSRPPDALNRGSRSRVGSISSRRSSTSERPGSEYESEGEERWGYSSGEEADSITSPAQMDSQSLLGSDFGSRPPSPSASLPLITMHADPFFGDTRIDIDLASRPISPAPPPGPPSRQDVVLLDEDMTLRLTGYEVVVWRQWVWRASCFVTLGSLSLFGHWSPRFWLRHVTREKAFKELKDGFIVVEVSCFMHPGP